MTTAEQAKYEYYRNQADYMQDEAFALGYAATAYVEDHLDKKFWSHIFREKKIHFQYFTRTEKGNQARGSGQCLLYKNYGLLNKEFFICIDSDYRFLLQEQEIDIQHFVFQTYTYSIENHFCYAKRLQKMSQDLGFQDFDFEAFLQDYSKIIFPLLAYSVYSEKNHIENDDMSITAFAKKITSFNTQNFSEKGKFMLEELAEKAENELNSLFDKLFFTKENLIETAEELNKMGISAENAYLHIRGHDLQDKLVLPILGNLKKTAILQAKPQEREKIHAQKLRDLIEDIEKNANFEYAQLSKIKQDIFTFFS